MQTKCTQTLKAGLSSVKCSKGQLAYTQAAGAPATVVQPPELALLI